MKYSSTIILVVICVIVFALQGLIAGFTDLFVLKSNLALSQPWRFFSAIFLHGDFAHLLYNMLALFFFGLVLESIIERKKFLIVFLVSGLVSSLAALIYPAALGASGAIFGILGTLVVLRPKMTAIVMGIPMPMIMAAVFWIAGDLLGLFFPSGIANVAHLAGLAVGFIFGFNYREYRLESKKSKRILREDEMQKWEDQWIVEK